MGELIPWVSCEYEEAEQYRWRYRTNSVGLVSPWSDWISSGDYPPAPSPMAMSKRYEYRKRFVYEPFGGKATITPSIHSEREKRQKDLLAETLHGVLHKIGVVNSVGGTGPELIAAAMDFLEHDTFPTAPGPLSAHDIDNRIDFYKDAGCITGIGTSYTSPTAPGKTMDGMEMVKHVFRNLTKSQRKDVFEDYCRECGLFDRDISNGCQCWRNK